MHPNAPNWNNFEPVGEERGDRDQNATIWHYLGVLILCSALGAGAAYLLLLLSIFGSSRRYRRTPRWWETEAAQGLNESAVLAWTGTIGAGIGCLCGAVICFRIWRRQIEETKRRAELAQRPPAFETPLEP